MNYQKPLKNLATLGLLIILGACNLPALNPTQSPSGEQPIVEQQLATPLPPTPETLITFQVSVPPDTPPEDTILLTILDDVTNLVLNAQLYPMEVVSGTQSARTYSLTLPMAIGSTVKYRFERQSNGTRVVEHLSDNNPVHYRLYHVSGQGNVQDIISCWADSEYNRLSGHIQGQVLDASNEKGVPGLMVAAGGMQTLTTSEGKFSLEGLPPGVHNLVTYALDGSYRTFQQGALVEAGNFTPVEIQTEAAPMVSIVFAVKVPGDTPPIVPLRLAGNLIQLGNTYANLNGGMSGLAGNMPVLNTLPDGRYTITLSLPAGSDVRYKYTLGDGFWNAEHDAEGRFVLRQLIVPEQTALFEDQVESWHDGSNNSLTFDVYVPAETPSEDTVSIQFNPLTGWTEPIPMWHLETDRWAYILYSPLNLPGEFHYRYCRNSQCGNADDIQTPGLYGRGRPLNLSEEPQTVQDGVNAWVDWFGEGLTETPVVTATVRTSGYWAGVEFQGAYHPSWLENMPKALDSIQAMNANWLVLSPTWSYPNTTSPGYLPRLTVIPGQDALWTDLQETISQAEERDLKVALYPKPNFPLDLDTWWLEAERSPEWWQHWFDNYRDFIIHHADLAEQSNASALIIGGEWLRPALPGGTLSDSTPSGVPEDAEKLWRDLFAEVRSRFGGKLIWAIPYEYIRQEAPFLDAVDQTYVLVSFSDELNTVDGLEENLDRFFDYNLLPFQVLSGRPLVLALDYPSNPDMESQMQAYDRLLQAAMERDWISGFVTRGYYPPAAMQDSSTSLHGKSASDLLREWYAGLLGVQ